MKVKILGCYGGALPGHRTTNFVVNDTIAIDAGALVQGLEFEEQLRIRHVFISHTHLDHTNSLPFLIDNIFGMTDQAVHVYALPVVIESMKRHLFNDETWPDFSKIPDEESALLKFHPIEPLECVTVDGVTVTAVPVNHIVPCTGFLCDDGTSAVLYSADTGPCPGLYEFANGVENLKALITEVSFPSEMGEIAELSKHLTPELLRGELARLEKKVDVFLYHLKPPHIERLHEEIRALALENVRCLDQDAVYEF